ncbi:MAG TPA: hypothetical protein P5056_04160, partial [Candidatus Paceibacterota bacterium]|nr:hypothetical protein [Candidatus Paceibacterota bacterium]
MCQLNNIETLQESQNVEKVLNQKAETLTVEFTRLLAEVYPQHEKDLFEKMTPDRVLALVIKYPEIKANTTVMELVTKIDQMRSAVYDQQILREKLKKDIRFNKRNPFLIQFFIPKE